MDGFDGSDRYLRTRTKLSIFQVIAGCVRKLGHGLIVDDFFTDPFFYEVI